MIMIHERIKITWVSREHHGSPRDIELWSRADQKSILAADLNKNHSHSIKIMNKS